MLTSSQHEQLARLQWLAAGVVEGLTAGRHRSPQLGASVEFKEHRAYVRGDEIRSIDWKLFGKSDRLFVRRYEDESNLRAMILLDQSGSMAYRGPQAALSKHQFGVQLAACLATLLIRQQDSVGLGIFDSCLRQTIPPRATGPHLRGILQALIESQCERDTGLAAALQEMAPHLRRRGLFVLISDCFEDPTHLLSALRGYRRSQCEVVVFQIWDRDELEFPFKGRTQFRSLETGQMSQPLNPAAIRGVYLERIQQFRQRLSDELHMERIELVSCTTNENLLELLSSYLNGRAGKLHKSRRGG